MVRQPPRDPEGIEDEAEEIDPVDRYFIRVEHISYSDELDHRYEPAIRLSKEASDAVGRGEFHTHGPPDADGMTWHEVYLEADRRQKEPRPIEDIVAAIKTDIVKRQTERGLPLPGAEIVAARPFAKAAAAKNWMSKEEWLERAGSYGRGFRPCRGLDYWKEVGDAMLKRRSHQKNETRAAAKRKKSSSGEQAVEIFFDWELYDAIERFEREEDFTRKSTAIFRVGALAARRQVREEHIASIAIGDKVSSGGAKGKLLADTNRDPTVDKRADEMRRLVNVEGKSISEAARIVSKTIGGAGGANRALYYERKKKFEPGCQGPPNLTGSASKYPITLVQ